MVVWPRTKRFSGYTFSFDTEHKTKAKANKRAKVLRNRGHYARIIKKKTKIYGVRYGVYWF